MADRSSPEIPREPPLETDLYDILGVSQDASTETIRSAYKKQALKNHPGMLIPSLSPHLVAQKKEKLTLKTRQGPYGRQRRSQPQIPANRLCLRDSLR